MTVSVDEIKEIIKQAVEEVAPAEDVLEKYIPAFANSFDPPLSVMTIHRWRRQQLLPEPSCNIIGVPYIRRSERLAAIEKLTERRDMKPSINPAAKKAGGA